MNQTKERTEAIYHFIETYIQEHQVSPSLQEIAKHIGIVPSTVLPHLDRLQAQGRLSREIGKVRSIRLIEDEIHLSSETTERIYQFIYDWYHEKAYAPSHAEIAKACYLAKSSVRRHLIHLEAQGKLQQGEGARHIILLVD